MRDAGTGSRCFTIRLVLYLQDTRTTEMASVRETKSFDDFYEYNYEKLSTNPLLNYYIIDVMDKIAEKEISPEFGFNISHENLDIAVLKTADVCLIYGEHFNDEMISLLSDRLPFNQFIRFYFAGSKNALEQLFKINNATYTTEKSRTIYKCVKVKDNFEYSLGQLEVGDITRLKELGNLSRAFTKSWEGKSENLDHYKMNVAAGIAKRNFFQWTYKTNIVAIAQVMYEPYNFPVIGHLYTNPAFRKQGYATSIVHAITKGLLEADNEYCMLTADSTNPASNKAFLKVGYESTGNYIRIWKNK